MKYKLLCFLFLLFNMVLSFSQISDEKQNNEQKQFDGLMLASGNDKISGCTYKNIPLYGKVQFVTSFPDFKVKYVTSFPDLKVQFVTSFPDSCGKWQVVESFPDFKVQIVDSFPDFTIEVVDSFPG